jgi:hypothetical protein
MRKIILSLLFVMAAGAIANAQQIAVVAPGGATSLYTSLDTAIIQAVAGSTVYLPDGGFQVKNETKITKKLTIIGVGHRADNENGSTMISGNLYFEGGADNSALMGVNLSENVYIGTGELAVNHFLLRYCNVNTVQVLNSNCQNIVINQNYIRNSSNGGNSAVKFTNNVLHSIVNVNSGVIDHNIVRHNTSVWPVYYALGNIPNSRISNNILIDPNRPHSGDNCIIRNNMFAESAALYGEWKGEDDIKVEDWNDVFEGPITGVTPVCNYQLKGSLGKNAATDGSDVGVYGGTGFSDSALPPIPRITRKKIAEQTDENGKLKIQIQVKAQ